MYLLKGIGKVLYEYLNLALFRQQLSFFGLLALLLQLLRVCVCVFVFTFNVEAERRTV